MTDLAISVFHRAGRWPFILRTACVALVIFSGSLLLCLQGLAQGNQPLLQITSPLNGTSVQSGQSISISVTSPAGVPFTQVLVGAQDPIGFSTVANSVPSQFSLSIPSDIAPGKYSLIAWAATGAGQTVLSQPIIIDVERQDFPIAMVADPLMLIFESQGEQLPIRIWGTFADASYLNLSQSSNITWSSGNSSVATVDATGVVAAIGTGTTSVTATYKSGSQNSRAVVSISVPPPALSPSLPTLSFGNQSVGTTSQSQPLTITNSSNSVFKILTISATGDFTEADNCVSSSSIQPSGTCTINASFSPTANGPRSGTLVITDDFAVVPVTVPLTGTGVGPAISFTPSSLTFDGQLLGTSSSQQTIKVMNGGASALFVSQVTATGDFTPTNNCVSSSPVAPVGTCNVNITFSPTAVGIRNGTVEITSNVTSSISVVNLIGAAMDFTVGTASNSSSSASISAGQPTTYNLQVNPLGPFSGAVMLSCTGAPAQSTCTPSASSLNVGSTAPTAFTVNVTTTARSLLAPPAGPNNFWRLPQRPPSLIQLLLLLLLLFLATMIMAVRSRSRARLYVAATLFLLWSGAFLGACGGGAGENAPPPSGTPAGNYMLTVTASQQGVNRSLNLTLTVN